MASDAAGSTNAALTVTVVDAVLGVIASPMLKRATMVLDQDFDLASDTSSAAASIEVDSEGFFRVRRGAAKQSKTQVLYSQGGFSTGAKNAAQFSLVLNLSGRSPCREDSDYAHFSLVVCLKAKRAVCTVKTAGFAVETGIGPNGEFLASL